MIEKKENGRKISNYNSKTKVVQIFMLIMTDRSRPAGKIKFKFKNFFPGNPGRTGPVTHGPGWKGACRWRQWGVLRTFLFHERSSQKRCGHEGLTELSYYQFSIDLDGLEVVLKDPRQIYAENTS